MEVVSSDSSSSSLHHHLLFVFRFIDDGAGSFQNEFVCENGTIESYGKSERIAGAAVPSIS